MCEHDPQDKKLNVRITLDKLQAEIAAARTHTTGLHALFDHKYKALHQQVVQAKDKWLVTRTDEDGQAAIELAQQAIALLAPANLAKLDVDTPMNWRVEQAIMGLQLRINRHKHLWLDMEVHPLETPYWVALINELVGLRDTYFLNPNPDTAFNLLDKINDGEVYFQGLSLATVSIGGETFAVAPTVK